MNKRKLFFVLIFLVCLLSISAASAADDASNDAISTDINDDLILEENINEVDVSSSSHEEPSLDENSGDPVLDSANEEALSENTPGTFTDLNNDINGNNDDIVYLDRDYTYDNSTDFRLRNGTVISRAVTIEGNGHTLDGAHIGRIFNVTNANAIFKNIIFINGNTTDYEHGGAIHGDCTIQDCAFINNMAYYSYGGAIYGNCTVQGCTFTNNTGDYYGGTIHGNCTIINSTFNENNGVIYGNCTVQNCNFNNNSKNRYALLGNYTLIDSNFTNNRGGVLEGACDAINCTFANNAGSNGIIKGNSTARNCIFENNTVSSYGGAVCRKG